MDQDGTEELQSRMPKQLKDYWLHGEGAAKIGWGTPGSFKRCVANLKGKFPKDTEGLCANLYHEATGRWPGANHSNEHASSTLATETDQGPVGGFEMATPRTWTTPGDSALAYEGQETGDGRLMAPDSIYWDMGPWPLRYAEEDLGEHVGAELCGVITNIFRDGDRIAASGYMLSTDAGMEAEMILDEGAPLGVSVDLDSVDVEFVDRSSGAVSYTASIAAAALEIDDEGWTLVASDGVVVGQQKSGDMLMRITRARIRGATLVSIPAFAGARIVLDGPPSYTAALTADAANSNYDKVIRYIRKSYKPITAAEAARFLNMPITTVRRHLARAAKEGLAVRLARGTYHIANEASGMTAAAVGNTKLPIATRDHAWDGPAAQTRVKNWADGDASKLKQAFLWVDDTKDGSNVTSYKLGIADVIDGTLTIIPRAVFAAEAAMAGARGGVDIPAADRDAVNARINTLLNRINEDQPANPGMHASADPVDDPDDALTASAWTAMRDLPPMPAAWFREPTAEELPPGAPGVNYKDGRVFGWVAQAGSQHAGFSKKLTIESLGEISTEHFLRQRFALDDGSTIKAGTFTMNVGHHRDGAECETSACQFDDTRFVAGIVTVGMNAGGMWFSGAAAPWLSEWDRSVFMACQPSYHMRNENGKWQLRAVLSVPVPGHSTPLLASTFQAVAGRAEMALTAAAAQAEYEAAIKAAAEPEPEPRHDRAQDDGIDYTRLADEIVAAMARADAKREQEAAELQALLAEASTMNVESVTEGSN